MPAQTKIKAYGYTRVSTDMQVDGASRKVQENTIREIAKANNLELQEPIYWEPGVSAKTARRPVLQEMLSRLSQKDCDVKALVVYDISRLSRNTSSFYREIAPILQEAGVGIYSLTSKFDDTPQAKYNLTMNVASAQLENDEKSVKVSKNMAQTAMDGWSVTRPPLGFKSERRYVVDETEDNNPRRKKHSILVPDNECDRASLVKQVLERFSEGDMTKMEITRYAEKIGLRTKDGKPLPLNSILWILKHPAYAGFNKSDTTTGGKMVKAKWDGLISEETYNRNLALLGYEQSEGCNFQSKYNKKDERYPLKGSVYCWQCGRPLRGSAPKNGSGGHSPRYHCNYCKGVSSVAPEELHESFLSVVDKITPCSEALKLSSEVLRRVFKDTMAKAQGSIEANNKALENLEAERIEAIRSVIAHTISPEDKILLDENREKEKQRLAVENARLQQQLELSESKVMQVLDVLKQPSVIWKSGSYEVRQAVQKLIFPEGIEVNLKQKKCGTKKISPLYSVLQTKNTTESGENCDMVISAGVEPALSG